MLLASEDIKQKQNERTNERLPGHGSGAEVAVLGSPSLLVLMVSVDVKQH